MKVYLYYQTAQKEERLASFRSAAVFFAKVDISRGTLFAPLFYDSIPLEITSVSFSEKSISIDAEYRDTERG
ncbi:MAG: hypothetical protein NUV49_01055 [Patescibacteria group bacterium]|nr:hypothetical protein [Patescibacteria group bacterium]